MANRFRSGCREIKFCVCVHLVCVSMPTEPGWKREGEEGREEGKEPGKETKKNRERSNVQCKAPTVVTTMYTYIHACMHVYIRRGNVQCKAPTVVAMETQWQTSQSMGPAPQRG